MGKNIWYGDRVCKTIRTGMVGKLYRCGETLRNTIRRGLGRSQETSGHGLHKRGLDPSVAGEYPKKVLGILRMSIKMEVNEELGIVRVGSSCAEEASKRGLKDVAPYGLFLETGTSKMAPRPWLSLGLAESWDRMQSIMRGKLSAGKSEGVTGMEAGED